jgi:hypothetical protein
VQRWACTAAAALAAALAAGCGGTATVTVVRTTTNQDETRVFGHIESLAPRGDGFELRFDPAWFLTGETASRAAAEDGRVEPGEPVPNDVYVVDESARLLTYAVPADADVEVLARGGTGFQPTPVPVSELVLILAGTSDVHLFEPLESGIWLTVRIDTVRRIEQQYRP